MLAALLATASACGDDDEGDIGGAGDPHARFATEVHPILVERCGTCHAPERAADGAPFAQSDRAAAYAAIQSQGLAIPKSDSAPLYRGAAGQLDGHASLATDVTDRERDRLLSWIQAGAPND